MQAICTRPGVGICFRDFGWYDKGYQVTDSHLDAENDRKPARTYNKILGNFLKILKPNDDARQQELAIKIIGAAPELLTEFVSISSPFLPVTDLAF
jgi:nucleolar pre-ribosomal-associated protein 1